MFKLVVLSALVACAVAAPGNLVAPVVAAPLIAAPAVAVPVAHSYHNTFRAPVIKAAPVVAAPLAVAHAPIVAHAAPVAVAHAVPVAPVVKTFAPAPLIVKSAHFGYIH